MPTAKKLPSTPTGRRRLLKLADLLTEDAKNKSGIRFDLEQWGSVSQPDEPVSCGTIGCAMGLAVASGAFERAGLLPPSAEGSLTPIFKVGRRKYFNFNAASKLFLIEYEEARFLFSFARYGKTRGAAGERAVAKRIRDFVAGKAAPQH